MAITASAIAPAGTRRATPPSTGRSANDTTALGVGPLDPVLDDIHRPGALGSTGAPQRAAAHEAVDEGDGCEPAAELFAQAAELDQLRTAVGGANGEGAHLGDRLPQCAVEPKGLGSPHPLRRELLGQEGSECLLQRELILAEGEVHVSPLVPAQRLPPTWVGADGAP